MVEFDLSVFLKLLESVPYVFGPCHSPNYLSAEMHAVAFSHRLTLIMSAPFSTRMTALMGNSSHCQHARRCEEGRADEWEGVIKKEMIDEEIKLLHDEGGWGWYGSWSMAWSSPTHCLWKVLKNAQQEIELLLFPLSPCLPPHAVEAAQYNG